MNYKKLKRIRLIFMSGYCFANLFSKSEKFICYHSRPLNSSSKLQSEFSLLLLDDKIWLQLCNGRNCPSCGHAPRETRSSTFMLGVDNITAKKRLENTQWRGIYLLGRRAQYMCPKEFAVDFSAYETNRTLAVKKSGRVNYPLLAGHMTWRFRQRTLRRFVFNWASFLTAGIPAIVMRGAQPSPHRKSRTSLRVALRAGAPFVGSAIPMLSKVVHVAQASFRARSSTVFENTWLTRLKCHLLLASQSVVSMASSVRIQKCLS